MNHTNSTPPARPPPKKKTLCSDQNLFFFNIAGRSRKLRMRTKDRPVFGCYSIVPPGFSRVSCDTATPLRRFSTSLVAIAASCATSSLWEIEGGARGGARVEDTCDYFALMGLGRGLQENGQPSIPGELAPPHSPRHSHTGLPSPPPHPLNRLFQSLA